ncbi:hypothetical protein GCM10010532_096040 [Dactylosporangium siamense]|uniref:Uncharacterized protein n=1 Tax=Dactylosporangium siamense TaxID=685454 RepID=A0A919UBW4_9ACTN|nr:hypothetical protein Dsi01nite_079400 [Dactylosporangium siamense]
MADPLYTGTSYFKNHADAQSVLDAYHNGSASVMGSHREGFVVRYDNVPGYNHNPGAGYLDQPTNLFLIKGTRSVSVVPISPNWTPRP